MAGHSVVILSGQAAWNVLFYAGGGWGSGSEVELSNVKDHYHCINNDLTQQLPNFSTHFSLITHLLFTVEV